MNLDYLDQDIPKYWILLLHYWLPLFKTPSDFYFKCRDFIDDLRCSGYKYFPWHKFPDLIFIFEKYAYEASEINISKKIIDTIFTKKSHIITKKLLAQFFERFHPDNTRTPILNDVLQQLPAKLYSEYFSKLNAVNCSSRNLKWCARLKDKFLLEDRLTFILSMPDNKLTANQSILFNLAIQECEEKFIMHKIESNFLNDNVIEHLLNFIFSRTPTLIFSNSFIRSLINQLLETQKPILISYILKLDAQDRYNFFESFLRGSKNFQKNTQYFFSLCPDEQWPDLIDQLIISVFNGTESEKTEDDVRKEKSTADSTDLLLLTQLQEQTITCPLKLFQFLAIQNLIEASFDLDAVKKIFTANHGSLEYHKNFPIEFQSAVVESSILAIKIFIKDHILIYVPKENTRKNAHRYFYQFFTDADIRKSVNIAELLLKKLPEHLQFKYKADLNFLQQLLSQLYLIAEDPNIAKFKNEHLMKQNKMHTEDEEKFEARRGLLQRIREGKQSSIAYQRMEELFAAEAPTMQEKWKKNLGVHFFDANDKEERKLALKEAAEIIKFNRECNTFCLSTSPSSTSYFAL
ncbi:MAG TPA: hypothetical protein VGH95_02640 [Candidatus Aquirickettsiella sp.]|jgi:hypothetical protein